MGVGEGGIGDKGDLASLPTFLSYIFGGHLTVPGVGFFWNLERTFTTPKHRLWHCTPVPSPPGWQLKKISPFIFNIFQPVKSVTFCFNLEILRRVEVRFLRFEWSRKNWKICNENPLSPSTGRLSSLNENFENVIVPKVRLRYEGYTFFVLKTLVYTTFLKNLFFNNHRGSFFMVYFP